jgi:hypothetical protein
MPENTPKTILTLSAVPDLLPEDRRSASVIERLLGLIDRGRGNAAQYQRRTDELIDYVWPEAGSLRAERDPLTPRLVRELAPISESERRRQWGDR